MSFVYFNVGRINQTEPTHFAISLIGIWKEVEKSLLGATSPLSSAR